jgi:GrpB-like predicted nucleotidyltransferase (UPF0157 family)
VLKLNKNKEVEKPLSEMTLEELWQLFPIILSPHDPEWESYYYEEKEAVLYCVGAENVSRISHIGSSAVPGLIAKPTVDILLELTFEANVEETISALKLNGWVLMSEQRRPELKLSFNKGYTPKGFAQKVFHLHIRSAGDWGELYFRDYLIDHPEVAENYGRLKRELLLRYEHNRDGYTEAKSEFVLRYTEQARKIYLGRYIP